MIVVFAGPTIGVTEARRILPEAVFRPPAARGDLYHARQHGANILILIDGAFTQTLAVSPTEIQQVIASGAVVVGAASLGAVRAAECWPLGMLGIGSIYQQFRSGELASDDEVAVVVDPDNGYRAVSVALVTVRAAVAATTQSGLITNEIGHALLVAAQDLPYPQRTWTAIFSRADVSSEHRPAVQLVPNPKRVDAEAALHHVALHQTGLIAATPATPATLEFQAPDRSPGLPAHLGFTDVPAAKLALADWLLGSGRIFNIAWALIAVSARPAQNVVAPNASSIREQLVSALRAWTADRVLLGELSWNELDYRDELDRELTLLWALVNQRMTASAIATERAHELVAIAQGYRNWAALRAGVDEAGCVHAAIPLDLIERQVRVIAGLG